MFQSRRQRKLKNTLGLVLKVLLIVALVVKLFDFDLTSWLKGASTNEVEVNTLPLKNDSEVLIEESPTDPEDKPRNQNRKTPIEDKPISNSVSIYIFNETGLERSIGSYIEKTFFANYKIKTGGSGDKSQLINGELGSSANTELVCVGEADYSFYNNKQQLITCKLNLFFDTYNKISGEKLSTLSQSFTVSGVGFSNAEALKVALRKVHP